MSGHRPRRPQRMRTISVAQDFTLNGRRPLLVPYPGSTEIIGGLYDTLRVFFSTHLFRYLEFTYAFNLPLSYQNRFSLQQLLHHQILLSPHILLELNLYLLHSQYFLVHSLCCLFLS